MLMENSGDACDREGTAATSQAPDSSDYRLFGRQSTIHQCMGGGLGTISTISVYELKFYHLFGYELNNLPVSHLIPFLDKF